MSVVSLDRGKKLRSKKWEIIDVPLIDELELLPEDDIVSMALPSGFCIRFFCHDMHHLYTVASQQVMVTRGVIDYLHDFNQLGPNKSRNKLFLCSQYDAEGTCRNGSLCREVHCRLKLANAEDAARYHVVSNATGAPNAVKTLPGAEIIEKRYNESPNAAVVVPPSLATSTPGAAEELTPLCTKVPSNSQDVVPSTAVTFIPDDVIVVHSLHSRWTSRRMYPTLPSGITFRVALPNTPTPVDTYESDSIFVTRGAKEYYEAVTKNEPLNVTMQHCAHYSKNGTCCFGEECQFVHVVHYHARERSEFDASCSDGESILASSMSSSSDSVVRSRTKRNNSSAKETPLSFGQEREPRSRKDSASSSRSASSGNRVGGGAPAAGSQGTSAQGSQQQVSGPSPMGAIGQPQGNQFIVPPAPSWVGSAVPQSAQQPLLFPSLQMHQAMQNPALVPQQAGQLMMMQGPNGEVYILPQGRAPPPQAAQQPFYVVPVQGFQGSQM